jgi:hypothetical protein
MSDEHETCEYVFDPDSPGTWVERRVRLPPSMTNSWTRTGCGPVRTTPRRGAITKAMGAYQTLEQLCGENALPDLKGPFFVRRQDML